MLKKRPFGEWMTAFNGLCNVIVYFIIISSILSSKKLRAIKTNHLVINLGIGHCIYGFVNAFGIWFDFKLSKIAYVGYIYANVAIMMLTVDRCVMIRWPFRYETMHIGIHVLLVSISPLAAALELTKAVMAGLQNNVVQDNSSMKVFIYGVSSIMVCLSIPNTLIFLTLQKQKAKLKLASQEVVKSRKKQILAFYVCFGCVITYVLFWMSPLIIAILWSYTNVNVSYDYFSIGMAIANFNPVSDALIFVWFNKQLRKRVKELFTTRNKLKCCIESKVSEEVI